MGGFLGDSLVSLKGITELWSLPQFGMFPGQEAISFCSTTGFHHNMMLHHWSKIEPWARSWAGTEQNNTILFISYLS